MTTRHLLLAATWLASTAGTAIAQNAATYDPDQLPAIHGMVSQYSLTPRGDVDGLILADGTEIRLPPHLGVQLVYAVKPGDAVTIRGLRARAIAMVQAASVRNDVTGASVTDNDPGGHPGPRGAQQKLSARGHIKTQLHGPQGDLNGALLSDGTIIRLPPLEAQRNAAMLAVGAAVDVEGNGFASPLGRVIEVSSMGPDANHLTEIAPAPRPGHRPPGGPDMPPPPPGRDGPPPPANP
jgi:hypothetical protein